MTEQADQRICVNAPAHSTALVQAFLAKHKIIQICQPPYSFMVFPEAKIAVGIAEICECDGHTVRKISQRRLTADLLAPWESDCSRMRS